MMPARRNQNWLPSIFNEFFGNEWLDRSNATAPAVNIIETESEYKVEVAAPGMTKNDFKVNINEDNELVISLEKQTERSEGDQQHQQQQQQTDRQQSDRDRTEENQSMQREHRHAHPAAKEPGDSAREGTYLRREFSYSRFQQSLILPDNIEKENIRARVENGVLTIEIPKRKEEERSEPARQIEIE